MNLLQVKGPIQFDGMVMDVDAFPFKPLSQDSRLAEAALAGA
jgi:hypothetical protein